MKIGIDVGNYDTKTANTSTPSSYMKTNIANALSNEEIFYNGAYYVPTFARNKQLTDKTQDNYCVIISLFAIAKEILFRIRKSGITDAKVIQEKISEITEVALGVGLPIGHYGVLADKTTDAYLKMAENGISFVYRQNKESYEFNFKVTRCLSFPQDYISVAYNRELKIPVEFGEYYVIGWGGGTVDIIPVVNATPQTDQSVTLQRGTTVMYNSVIRDIQYETGNTLSYQTVENVLLKKPTVINESLKARIEELADAYCKSVIDDIINRGIKLEQVPCIVIGGGGQLHKATILKSNKIAKVEVVDDVRINAKYYEQFL